MSAREVPVSLSCVLKAQLEKTQVGPEEGRSGAPLLSQVQSGPLRWNQGTWTEESLQGLTPNGCLPSITFYRLSSTPSQ